jgi:hypothetical protein
MSDIDIKNAQLGDADGFLGAPATLETTAPARTVAGGIMWAARFTRCLVPTKEIENELK